ncbi:hypothetical protein [Psychrosphaera aestuarii]|uniref:hypothetical protein n=1 Tax=Psychrosphaera aestuarii TaxID=1266052 RepID=UPI001B318EF1|nr:hypothetical protein [Psychrosphaera aestuarii]
MSFNASTINKDSNLFMVDGLPLITVYDDNFFVRNDYDVLSVGQRNYLIRYFNKLGFTQTSGKTLTKSITTLHIPKPNSNLAVSSFDERFLKFDGANYYCVTPTMFAEALFYLTLDKQNHDVIKTLRRLIKKCPYNIEWLRDVSYHSPIENITKHTYQDLVDYQSFIVQKRYKKKKSL